MHCQSCRDNFILLWDETGGSEAEAARAHLQQCSACQQAWAEYQATVTALRQLPPVRPPTGWQQQIQQVLDEVERGGRQTLPWWQPVMAGASLAACLALVLWAVVLSPGPTAETAAGRYHGPPTGLVQTAGRALEREAGVGAGGHSREGWASRLPGAREARGEMREASGARGGRGAQREVRGSPEGRELRGGRGPVTRAGREGRGDRADRSRGREFGPGDRPMEAGGLEAVRGLTVAGGHGALLWGGWANRVVTGAGQQGGPGEAPEVAGAAGPRGGQQPEVAGQLRGSGRASGREAPGGYGAVRGPGAAEGGGQGSREGGRSKPTGTLAAPTDRPAEPPALLQRQGGQLKLTFVPPAVRLVGEPTMGELQISGQAEALVTVTARARRGLQVGREGVLYEGSLRRGELLKVPVRLVAAEPGTQRVQMALSSDVPGVAAELEVMIPDFVGERIKVGERQVTARLRGMAAGDAWRVLAAEAGARVVVHEGVAADHLVTCDCSAGVPFEAAVRVLCEQLGCRFEVRGDVYHILQ